MSIFDGALLDQTVVEATPILFAAMGEVVSEQAGVMNIGLEGMMLGGAFFGFWVAHAAGSVWVGVAGAAAAGIALGAIMALAVIRGRANQIVVGIAITLLATGLTTFLFQAVFASSGPSGSVGVAGLGTTIRPMASLRIPLLADIPAVGGALFDQPPLVYIAFALVPLVSLLLHHTRWGLAIRAAGELPEAADVAGVSVHWVRWLATLWAGALAGVAGAFLSLAQVGSFTDGMSAGRGYLALSAVIFGAWKPSGALLGCLLFGFADSIELRLQGLSTVPDAIWLALLIGLVLYGVLWAHRNARRAPLRGDTLLVGISLAVAIGGASLLAGLHPTVQLPGEIWLATPYVLTLIALASVRSRQPAPRYLGIAYLRGGSDDH